MLHHAASLPGKAWQTRIEAMVSELGAEKTLDDLMKQTFLSSHSQRE